MQDARWKFTAPGVPTPRPLDREKVQAFVTRCYRQALGREPDGEGLAGWTDAIMNRTMTPEAVAKSFLESAEFTGKNLDDEAFVTVLYRLYLGREPDAEGKANWINSLAEGTMNRSSILNGFSGSAEFRQILAGFGL